MLLDIYKRQWTKAKVLNIKSSSIERLNKQILIMLKLEEKKEELEKLREEYTNKSGQNINRDLDPSRKKELEAQIEELYYSLGLKDRDLNKLCRCRVKHFNMLLRANTWLNANLKT